jgi:hypothetical protein
MRVKAFFEIRCNVFSDSRGDRENDHYNEHLTKFVTQTRLFWGSNGAGLVINCLRALSEYSRTLIGIFMKEMG